MVCTEINPEGKFSTWDPKHYEELRDNRISHSLGQRRVFENESIVLWSIVLAPQERLPFTYHNRYYSWTCRAGGVALSRDANGCIYLLKFEEGDTGMVDKHLEADCIRDLQNVGDEILEFKLIEFKQDQHTGHFVETL